MSQEATRGNRLEKRCVQHEPLKDNRGKHLTLTLCASLRNPIAVAGLQLIKSLMQQKQEPKHTYWRFIFLGLQARPAHVNFPDSIAQLKANMRMPLEVTEKCRKANHQYYPILQSFYSNLFQTTWRCSLDTLSLSKISLVSSRHQINIEQTSRRHRLSLPRWATRGYSSLCHEDLSAIDGHQIIRFSGEGKGVRIVDEFRDLLESDILCKT